MKMLDENGFVFVSKGKAYQVRMWGEKPWLCYWNENAKCFVTLRSINQNEVWQYEKMSLPGDQAELYFKQMGNTAKGGA